MTAKISNTERVSKIETYQSTMKEQDQVVLKLLHRSKSRISWVLAKLRQSLFDDIQRV